ncbi:MAG: hypothetical protein GX112_10785 [Clostridiaceae bacterium]|nr:hypothetical protein [Clostridiaceae bacterium]
MLPIAIKKGHAEPVEAISVLLQDGKPYINAFDFLGLTRYTTSHEGTMLKMVMGAKTVVYEMVSGSVTVFGKAFPAAPAIEYNNMTWLPADDLLPWLNVQVLVENGTLLIIPDALSFWEFYPDFAPMSYYFDIADEFGSKAGASTVMYSMFLLDTLFKTRVDRFIPVTGINKPDGLFSWRDYDIYLELFQELAYDKYMSDELLNDLDDYTTDLADSLALFKGLATAGTTAEKFYASLSLDERLLIQHIETMKEVKDALKVKQVVDAISLGLSIVGASEEYDDAIAAVYDVKKAKATSLAEQAAAHAYILYRQNKASIAAVGGTFVADIIQDAAEDMVLDAIGGSWKVYLGGIDAVLSGIWPINEAAEGITKLPQIAVIQQDALDAYIEHTDLANLSYNQVQAARLSATMFLRAAKKGIEVTQTLIDRFGGEQINDERIAEYDSRLMQLAFCMPATLNDSQDGKTEAGANIRNLLAGLVKHEPVSTTTTTAAPTTQTTSTTALVKDDLTFITGLLHATRPEVIAAIGADYTVVEAGPESTYEGLYDPKRDLTFVFYPEGTPADPEYGIDEEDLDRVVEVECGPDARIGQTHVGMSVDDIIASLGAPNDIFSLNEAGEVWFYLFRMDELAVLFGGYGPGDPTFSCTIYADTAPDQDTVNISYSWLLHRTLADIEKWYGPADNPYSPRGADEYLNQIWEGYQYEQDDLVFFTNDRAEIVSVGTGTLNAAWLGTAEDVKTGMSFTKIQQLLGDALTKEAWYGDEEGAFLLPALQYRVDGCLIVIFSRNKDEPQADELFVYRD